MHEIALGCTVEGKALLRQSTEQLKHIRQQARAQAAASDTGFDQETDRSGQAPSQAPPPETPEQYFKGRLKRREREARLLGNGTEQGAPQPDEGHGDSDTNSQDEDQSDNDVNKRYRLSDGEFDVVEERLRRLHGAATLAAACCDSAAPLMLSSNLKVCVSAMGVCALCLSSLQATTTAAQQDEAIIEECCDKTQRALRPTRPKVPPLLPAVAAVWPPTVAALKDPRLPVAERALALLGDLAIVSGKQR